MSNILDIHKEKGVSFLEIIVVVAILGVTAFFVMPSLSSWKINSMIEGDFGALISQIEYIKSRASVMNGTGILICSANNKLTYQISSNRQTSYTVVDPLFSSTLLEDTSSSNALSGKTNLVSSMCSGRRGIFLSNGFSGLELGGLIDIEVNYLNNKVSYPAYRVNVSQSTSFVQKYQWNSKLGIWTEIE
jgi:Tfp pilus assembly protein FimT